MANKKNMSIKLSNSIKHIAIMNENDEVITELLVDSSDNSIMGRLMDLVDRCNEIKDGTEEKLSKYNLGDGATVSEEQAREILKINEESVNEIIAETNLMFGAGVVERMFADNYALNPQYVPDISLLGEFYQQIMPIIGDLFKDKTNKYSTKKGR